MYQLPTVKLFILLLKNIHTVYLPDGPVYNRSDERLEAMLGLRIRIRNPVSARGIWALKTE